MPESCIQNIKPSIRESSAKKDDLRGFPSVSMHACITIIFSHFDAPPVDVLTFVLFLPPLPNFALLAMQAAMPPLMLQHLWLIVTFVMFFAATSTVCCLLPAAMMLPRTTDAAAPLISCCHFHSMRCLLPAMMILHGSCRHATTHAAAPPVDCYNPHSCCCTC